MIPGFEEVEKSYKNLEKSYNEILQQLYYEEKIKLLNLAKAKTK